VTGFGWRPSYVRAAGAILVALLVRTPAVNAAGGDFVELKSGNRMTGEVTELSRGQLSFAIDGAGTVEIDWRNVERLQSSQDLDIELSSGERFAGSIGTPFARRLEVKTPAGPRVIDADAVVRMTPIAATFHDRTSGFIDLGVGILGANDEVDLTLNAEAENRTRNRLIYASVYSLVRRRDEVTDQRRNHFELGSRRFLPDRWFALAQIEAEEDRELDLDSRVLLAGGMGRTLQQSQRMSFALFGGLDYALEDYRGVPGNDDSFEVLAGLEWDWFEVAGGTELLTEATSYYSLDRSRVRVELNASLHRDLFRNFYWSLNLFHSYDSDPPADLERSDFGVTLTLGSSF
jgi:hypothetical protein